MHELNCGLSRAQKPPQLLPTPLRCLQFFLACRPNLNLCCFPVWKLRVKRADLLLEPVWIGGCLFMLPLDDMLSNLLSLSQFPCSSHLIADKRAVCCHWVARRMSFFAFSGLVGASPNRLSYTIRVMRLLTTCSQQRLPRFVRCATRLSNNGAFTDWIACKISS